MLSTLLGPALRLAPLPAVFSGPWAPLVIPAVLYVIANRTVKLSIR